MHSPLWTLTHAWAVAIGYSCFFVEKCILWVHSQKSMQPVTTKHAVHRPVSACALPLVAYRLLAHVQGRFSNTPRGTAWTLHTCFSMDKATGRVQPVPQSYFRTFEEQPSHQNGLNYSACTISVNGNQTNSYVNIFDNIKIDWNISKNCSIVNQGLLVNWRSGPEFYHITILTFPFPFPVSVYVWWAPTLHAGVKTMFFVYEVVEY